MADEVVEGEFENLPQLPAVIGNQSMMVPQEQSKFQALLLMAQQIRRDPKIIEDAIRSAAGYLGSKVKKDKDGNDAGTSLAVWGYKIGGQWQEGITILMASEVLNAYGWAMVDVTLESVSGDMASGGEIIGKVSYIDLKNGSGFSRPFISAISKPSGGYAVKKEWYHNNAKLKEPRLTPNIEGMNRWRTMQMNSAFSKAQRGAIERGVGKYWCNVALEEAKLAMSKDILKGVPLPEAKLMMIDRFSKLDPSVGVKELEFYLEANMSAWTDRDVLKLRQTLTSIVEGVEDHRKMFWDQQPAATTITMEQVNNATATVTQNPNASNAPAPGPTPQPPPAPANGTAPAEPQKRRGRPPGSANKPQDAPGQAGSPAPAGPQPVTQTAPPAPVQASQQAAEGSTPAQLMAVQARLAKVAKAALEAKVHNAPREEMIRQVMDLFKVKKNADAANKALDAFEATHLKKEIKPVDSNTAGSVQLQTPAAPAPPKVEAMLGAQVPPPDAPEREPGSDDEPPFDPDQNEFAASYDSP